MSVSGTFSVLADNVTEANSLAVEELNRLGVAPCQYDMHAKGESWGSTRLHTWWSVDWYVTPGGTS